MATVSVPAAPLRFSEPVTVRSPFTVVVARLVFPEEDSVVAETEAPEIEPPEMPALVMVGLVRSSASRCSMRPTLAAAAYTLVTLVVCAAVDVKSWEESLASSAASLRSRISSVMPPEETRRVVSTMRSTTGFWMMVCATDARVVDVGDAGARLGVYGATETETEPPVFF